MLLHVPGGALTICAMHAPGMDALCFNAAAVN